MTNTHNVTYKYRNQIEQWIATSITDEHICTHPDQLYAFDDKVMAVLGDMSETELTDMYLQHACGYSLEELESDIEYDLAHEVTTCAITRGDRIRLGNINKQCSLTTNITTVLDLYDRSLMSPAQIDAANISEVSEAEHVIELALEVLHDNVPEGDEWS